MARGGWLDDAEVDCPLVESGGTRPTLARRRGRGPCVAGHLSRYRGLQMTNHSAGQHVQYIV